MQARHDVGRLGHRGDDVVRERGRCGLVKRPAPGRRPPREARSRRGQAVAELDAVGVDVLTEQGDLDDPLLHQCLDLGQDVARAAVGLLAPQARDDAERAGVVAAHRDRDPTAVGGVAAGRQGGGEDLERLENLDLGLAVVAGAVEQRGQAADVGQVPKTTSTQGARWTMVARSFCAMQPPTAICISGLRVFAGRPRLP